MILCLRYASRTDRGLVREGNEDSAYAGPHVLAVADGMGGHVAGEIASREVIKAVAALDSQPIGDDLLNPLLQAMDRGNARLRELVTENTQLEGMGTTLTAIMFSSPRIALIHVGDSRLYRLREDQFEQLTHDDTLVQSLVDEGRISEAEAETHPQRSLLTQALDGRKVEPALVLFEGTLGDRYLLCTDGLSGVVPQEDLLGCMRLPDPQDAVDHLVELALTYGAPDNVTCIVADLIAVPGPIEPVTSPAETSHASSMATVGHTAEFRSAPVLADAQSTAVLAPPNPASIGLSAPPTDEPGVTLDEDERSSRRRRWVTVFVIGIIFLLGAALVVWRTLASRYYVADNAGYVAIYKGVDVSIGPLELSEVHTTTQVETADLEPAYRTDIQEGIPADDLQDAQRIVTELEGHLLPICPAQPPAGGAQVPGEDCREESG